MTKKTIIDQIEITRDGTIQVRLGLLNIDEDGEETSKWLRFAIHPGTNHLEFIPLLNNYLQQNNKEILTNTILLDNVVTLVHTKEVVDIYVEKQEKIISEMPGEISSEIPSEIIIKGN